MNKLQINKLPFLHYAGDCFLAGRNVEVTGNDEVRELRAETIGGKWIVGSRVITVSRAEYRNLRDQWTDGGKLDDQDVEVTRRALAHLGALQEGI